MKALISVAILGFLAGCHPSQSSKVNESWNKANNPVIMMAYKNEFKTKLSELPTSGQPEKMPWSDNYWPTYQGGITYRWDWDKTKALSRLERDSSDSEFAGQLDDNAELQKLRSEVYAYKPYTKDELAAMPEAERTQLISSLSPAEKYDIYRGLFNYPTVESERVRTDILSTIRDQPKYVKDRKIPTWFGICHAWAPATIIFNEPGKLSTTSKDGFQVNLAASDIKALLSHMLDKDPSQARENSFLAQRCNNDLSSGSIKELTGLIATLKIGDTDQINAKIEELLKSEKIDLPTKMAVAAHIIVFAKDQPTALAEYQKVYEKIRAGTRAGDRAALSLVYVDSQKNLAFAGTPEGTNRATLEGAIVKSVQTPACNDTNPGAFHLVLANLLGIQRKSFGLDVTRDAEVWNQAAASYQSNRIAEFTGDKLSENVAPGTVKEVQLRTLFRYTTEMAPAWEPFGDDANLQSYHVFAGDTYNFGGRRYKLELDKDDNIIGGSWISEVRPDFLWGTGTPVFNKEFADLEDLYYSAL